MSALARYFNARGVAVSGYDKTATELTAALQAEGISIHFEEDIENIPQRVRDKTADTLVIYTPAIPNDHAELVWLQEKGIQLYKRSQVLGMITAESFTIGVAGTHGKTTTSTIIAHMLKVCDYQSNAFLGGIATNYDSNTLLDKDAKATVVEADEFDRSFLTLYPDIAVVTSMDADHLDIYGDKSELETSFRLYVNQVKPGGKVICKKGLPLEQPGNEVITYSATETADVFASNINIQDGEYHFNLHADHVFIEDMVLGLAGLHNVENAIAAAAVGLSLKLDPQKIKEAFASFKGVKRRFEYQVRSKELIYIDDYAHHPAELEATIASVKEMYPDCKITGVFQPHLFTRTRDFADEFARSLEMLNELILLEIYPARELPIEGVSGQMLLDKVQLEEKCLLSKQELIPNLRERQLEVLLTLGAGDIDQLVAPIKYALEERLELRN